MTSLVVYLKLDSYGERALLLTRERALICSKAGESCSPILEANLS